TEGSERCRKPSLRNTSSTRRKQMSNLQYGTLRYLIHHEVDVEDLGIYNLSTLGSLIQRGWVERTGSRLSVTVPGMEALHGLPSGRSQLPPARWRNQRPGTHSAAHQQAAHHAESRLAMLKLEDHMDDRGAFEMAMFRARMKAEEQGLNPTFAEMLQL